MKKNILIFIGIFVSLAVSRFAPHPPNFTSLLALSFYVPVLLGVRYLPVLLISFAITDLVIGYHAGTHWTWGSVVIIGLISQYFKNSIYKRLGGALSGALIFFIITNFGVWVNGSYGYSFNGLLSCYTLAIPFFTYSLISTFVFSGIIEALIKIKFLKFNHKYFEKI